MEVNQQRLKTCAIVFLCHNAKSPEGVVLRYSGDAAPFREWSKYLDVVWLSTRGVLGAADAFIGRI